MKYSLPCLPHLILSILTRQHFASLSPPHTLPCPVYPSICVCHAVTNVCIHHTLLARKTYHSLAISSKYKQYFVVSLHLSLYCSRFVSRKKPRLINIAAISISSLQQFLPVLLLHVSLLKAGASSTCIV